MGDKGQPKRIQFVGTPYQVPPNPNIPNTSNFLDGLKFRKETKAGKEAVERIFNASIKSLNKEALKEKPKKEKIM